MKETYSIVRMLRRSFLGGSVSSLLGYRFLVNISSLNIPTDLVHTHAETIPSIVVRENDLLLQNVPSEITNIVITKNSSSNIQDIHALEKYELQSGGNTYKLDFPNQNIASNDIVYTVYKSTEDGFEYLSESDSGSLGMNEEYSMIRRSRRGYYLIECLLDRYTDIDYNERITFPVSKQKFRNHKRYLGYGSAHTKMYHNPLVTIVANKFSQIDDKYDRLKSIVKTLQKLTWVSDIESKGRLEYIRRPVETFVEQKGDCKDTSILINGLIANALGYETTILFLPAHMTAGIKYDSVSKEVIQKLKNEESEFTTVTLNDEKYIPIEGTAPQDIGHINNSDDIFAHHNLSSGYHIDDASTIVQKHPKEAIDRIWHETNNA